MDSKRVLGTLLHGKSLEYTLIMNAINFAEAGHNVWFISPEQFTAIPDGVRRPNTDALRLLTFLYLKEHKELLRHINGIHLWHKVPELIVLNNFQHYINLQSDNFNPSLAALIVASFLDAATSCSDRLNSSKIYLIFGCQNNDEKAVLRLQRIVDLYFDKVLLIDDTNIGFDVFLNINN